MDSCDASNMNKRKKQRAGIYANINIIGILEGLKKTTKENLERKAMRKMVETKEKNYAILKLDISEKDIDLEECKKINKM